MADQMYSMCWGPSQVSQYQDEDQHKLERYPRQITTGNGQDSSNEEIGCVTMAADSLVSHESNCKTPGYCINGKPISLTHLAQNGLEVEIPSGMVLAGAKSPLLGKLILVAAVDKRFLPCDSTSPTTLGFSGSCVGCGDPHFRYFTEFANHINLVLATQPKKQKHLKCYVLRDNLGRLCRGPRIPWRDTPRKRPFPYPDYQSVMDGQTARHMASEVSSSSFTPPSVVSINHNALSLREGRSSTSSQSSCDSGSSSFDHSVSPLYKRSRDDFEKDGEAPPLHAWVEAVCGIRPVLVLGYPNHMPHFMNCYKEIIVSDMLAECFEFTNNPSRSLSAGIQYANRAYHAQQQTASQPRGTFSHPDMRLDSSPSTNLALPQLAVNVLVILMAQYLSQLSEDMTISKEEFLQLIQNSKEILWQTYQENSAVQPFVRTIDSGNLVHVVSLATLPSKGSVKLVSSVISLNDAINKGLGFLYQISKHNQHREIKLQVPHYLLLLSCPQGKNPEFCVMVTGVNQAKFLQELLVKENTLVTSHELNDYMTTLDRTYHMLNMTIDHLIKQFELTIVKNKLVFLPFNGNSTLKIPEVEAASMLPKLGLVTSYQPPEFGLHSAQVTTAHHLLSCVLASNDGIPVFNLRHFSSVDFRVVIPKSPTYFHQILHQLKNSDVLVELGLGPPTQSQDTGLISEHIIQNNGSEASKLQLKDFLINAKSCLDVLFILVCEQAHQYFAPDTSTSLPYFSEILRLPNVLVILSTPTPYLFQTCQSRIKLDNEVYWTDPANTAGPFATSDHKVLAGNVHFGMREYTESLNWTHQIPLIREDDEFENLALKVNLTTVPSNIVRTYLLIHHYTTAIMWSAGMRSIEPHCTFKTLQVIRDIVESPLRNTAGRGAMLVVRVPCTTLATWAYKKLKDTRDRVGFRYRFAVINDDGESGLHVEEYFLQRLRLWRNGKASSDDPSSINDWYPERYKDLLDLPCIVLVSGRERTEDMFPRSLKYCDLRLLHEECFHRSTLELEFNFVSRYINSGLATSSQDCTRGASSNNSSPGTGDKAREINVSQSEKTRIDTRNQFCSSYPLPVLLVSRTAYRVLQKDFFGCPKHLCLSSDPAVEWNSDQKPALVSDLPSEQSKYYRRWTKPKGNSSSSLKDKGSSEVNQSKYYPRCFLFSGHPQVGKTASILHFIRLLYGTLLKLQRVDVYDEVPDSSNTPELIPSFEMDQPNPKILSKTPFNPTLVGTRFAMVSRVQARTKNDKAKKEVKVTNGNCDVSSDVPSKEPPTSSVMMSPFAAYDSYHHCDECKNYREGLGLTSSSKHVTTLSAGEQLTFVIPSARREWFTFNENNELRTLKLPVVTRKSTSEGWKLEVQHCERNLASKTPIFTPSAGRHEQGLLNLYHAMEGRNHVHLIFVKNNELSLYQKIWPNHVIVGLPPACNSRGLGMTKNIIKEFATQNLLAERKRQQCDSSNFVWPFVHIMDDSCVMWQSLTIDSSNNFQEDSRSKSGEWSLLQTTKLVESSPNITSFALIGFNQWGTGNLAQYKLNSYSVCQVHSSLFLNIDSTRHVNYNHRLFSWEQVDFNLRLSSSGGLVLRYNHINMLKKRIPVGGGRGINVAPNIDDIISLPDRDPAHVIPAPAHYLLEEYLRLKAGEKIFPAACGNPVNPVLLLDCFVNLGPSVNVEHRSMVSTDREGNGSTVYGGILLYLCAGCNVTKEVLRDIRFCPGAKICVISSDRSSLRDQVVKLDLEEHWRFRLRDEFKTASSLGDESLYFLTGTYDG